MSQDIKDLSYAIQNGKTGSSFTNILPQTLVSEDEASMLLDDTELTDRMAVIAGLLNAVYGVSDGTGDVFVSKINYPLVTDTPDAAAADAPVSVRMVCLAEVRNIDNVGPTRKLSVKIDGVPLDATLASIKTDLIAMLDDMFGFCTDGVTKRFVGLVWSKLAGIPAKR